MILDIASFYLSFGWSVIPLKPHSKHPLVRWKEFQSRLATEDAVENWKRQFPMAVLFCAPGQDRSGRPLKVISPEMRLIFGDFDGKISFQRGPTRWVALAFTAAAAEYVRSLK